MGIRRNLSEATPINSNHLMISRGDSGATSSSRMAINASTNDLEYGGADGGVDGGPGGGGGVPGAGCCSSLTGDKKKLRTTLAVAAVVSVAVFVPVCWFLAHYSNNNDGGRPSSTSTGDASRDGGARHAAAFALMDGFRDLNVTVTEPPGYGNKAGGMKDEVDLFDNFVDGTYTEAAPGGFWATDVDYVKKRENGDVVVTNVVTEKFSTLVPNRTFRDLSVDEFDPSPDLSKVLLAAEVEDIFRHSKTAKYYIYDVTSGTITFLTPKIDDHERLQAALWSPTSDGVAFVHEGDIYYQRTSTPVNNDLMRLTRSSDPQRVTNGILDWVYEEEVLKSGHSLWFDDSGTKLAYLKFDDREVHDMFFSEYGPPENQYPEIFTYKYPKPGTPNPKVTAHVVDLTAPGLPTATLLPPPEVARNDYIISSAYWQPKSTNFHITWLNRAQNVTVFSTCSPSGLAMRRQLSVYRLDEENDRFHSNDWHCQVLHIDRVPGGWAPSLKQAWFDHAGSEFLQILYVDQSGGNGKYPHIVKSGSQPGSQGPFPLTSGLLTVTDIVAYNSDASQVFFLGTPRSHPGHVYLYSTGTKIQGPSFSSRKDQTICISCHWTNSRGQPCLKAGAEFSQNASYFLFRCESRFQPPEFQLYETSTMKQLRVMLDNAKVLSHYSELDLPLQLDLSVPVGGGDTAEVRMLLPSDFDPKAAAKYPLIVSVYGAPDYQSISEAYIGLDWNIYLASEEKYILVTIDGRGSSSKNKEYSFKLFHALGTLEVDDQVNVARYLSKSLSFIDETRMGIWGWSYGGFVSALALTRNNSVFQCGISVAPVTNWLYYDSIYAERYMGLPSEFPDAYSQSDLTSMADSFRGKSFYLIHGNADDNVHYQQSMMLSKALEKADVLFRQQSYPDEDHNLEGVSRHFYHSMLKFWQDCFK